MYSAMQNHYKHEEFCRVLLNENETLSSFPRFQISIQNFYVLRKGKRLEKDSIFICLSLSWIG